MKTSEIKKMIIDRLKRDFARMTKSELLEVYSTNVTIGEEIQKEIMKRDLMEKETFNDRTN